VKPTVSEPPLIVMDKGKNINGGDILVSQKLPTIRRPPICYHCSLSGHVRPQCSLLKAQISKVKKEVPRQANFGTRSPAQHKAPRHQAPQYQAPWHQAPQRQAPQHQRPQQRFVLANQNGKPNANKSRHFKKKPQKMEDDQFYQELPIWMQSMIQWMDHQMKAYPQPPKGRQAWVRKEADISP
jgi:hypothetical protein